MTGTQAQYTTLRRSAKEYLANLVPECVGSVRSRNGTYLALFLWVRGSARNITSS